MEELTKFINRLAKLDIKINLASNYPWVYLYKVNNKYVKETFQSDHGFLIGFLPIKPNKIFKFIDIGELFKIIRKYK